MPTDTVNPQHERYLLELTSLPTASGREDRVVEWVQRWKKGRTDVQLRRDRFGNVMLQRAKGRKTHPIVFAAHMDHPAFVVAAVRDARTVEADFRGGVGDAYFKDAAVRWHGSRGSAVGVVRELNPPEPPRLDKRAVIEFAEEVPAAVGDVVTWDLPEAHGRDGRVYAPACDDLAGVAAAIAAMESLLDAGDPADVRVLLTRAEEVGFVGAMAACRSGILPRRSRIVALENSKSFAESPIGGGPIVRVGDRTSTFDPDLTYRVGKVAERLAAEDAGFAWQRKLMPGGTCEASAYQALGYTATCVCLPLGNYHNMNEETKRIDSETIALSDFHGLVRLLVRVGEVFDDLDQSPSLRVRLDAIYEERRSLLEA